MNRGMWWGQLLGIVIGWSVGLLIALTLDVDKTWWGLVLVAVVMLVSQIAGGVLGSRRP